MVTTRRSVKTLVAIFVAVMFMMPLSALDAASGKSKRIDTGLIWVVDKNTRLSSLTIADGAFIMAPNGQSVTMTVDGIETGIVPGTYNGDIVLTLTETNIFKYLQLNHHYRQALYLDKTGVVEAKSVTAAAGNYRLSNGVLTGAKITSRGENFNGIFVAGGKYVIKDAVIDFTGNGGDDFDGYGAAVMAAGKDTTLILDGAKIKTHGAARPTVVATRNSNVIVKNSTLQAMDGILQADYVPNVELGKMRAVPWMLGLSGNCRATNLLGRNTTATYINSSISSESWGVLSADGDDDSQEPVAASSREQRLIAINSKITNTGKVGYGNYFTASYYGCDIDVGDYASIGGGMYAASDPETIAKLNADYGFGLTAEELKSLKRARTHVKSGRFGAMVQSSVKVMDDTIFDTEKAVFLVKGAAANISVDGSKGAQLNSKNGIIIQILENDDPMSINAIYHEPEDPVKVNDFDVTAVNKSDVTATFSNITLKGDFYNGFPGGRSSGPGGMPGGAAGGSGEMLGGGMPEGAPGGIPGGDAGGPGGGMFGGGALGKNFVLNLTNADITGVITASRARHAKDTITSEDYLLLGEVTNRPCAAVNNGVIVAMTASRWTVTGTSYLTNLTIGEGSTVKAPDGYILKMSADGVEKAIKAGTYKGNIVITLTKS
jgi:hypothetical protein